MRYLLFILIILTALAGNGGSTRVGNGDDGSDLEGATLIESGPIKRAQDKAVKLLKDLRVQGIRGLGTLASEVESSKTYMADKDVSVSIEDDRGGFHSDMRGKVFARTFARVHASTRFFPIAKSLTEDQLVALHIHEGLHRSLPAEIREDESKVAAITLSVTAPDANHDGIYDQVAEYIPQKSQEPKSGAAMSSAQLDDTVPADARVRNPSEFGYTYRNFRRSDTSPSYPVNSMHVIESFMFPFGTMRRPLGFGIKAGVINRDSGSKMGPLGISSRMRIWSGRGFDVGFWNEVSINVLSADELKNSALGRDVISLGLSMKKTLDILYFENFLGYTAESKAKQKIGNIDYEHKYGGIVNVEIHAGAKLSKFNIGGYGEFWVGDYYRLSGGAYAFDSGRYRILAAGPEVSYTTPSFAVGMTGKLIVDHTEGANLDYLGNLLGEGVSQGSVNGTVKFFF